MTAADSTAEPGVAPRPAGFQCSSPKSSAGTSHHTARERNRAASPCIR